MTIADASLKIRHVFLHDMVLDMRIGVYADEHGRRQRVRLSVDLGAQETGEPVEDRLEQVVDYAAVAERVREVALAGHIKLVETLAERLAAMCLTEFCVISARIRVEKLDAFDDIGSAGVEIERTRAAHRPPIAD